MLRREAIRISKFLGTWWLYELRDARDPTHLVGWMRYHVDLQRDTIDSKALGYWRKAIRWASAIGPDEVSEVASLVLRYVADNEVPLLFSPGGNGHPSFEGVEAPPRSYRRERIRTTRSAKIDRCESCGQVIV